MFKEINNFLPNNFLSDILTNSFSWYITDTTKIKGRVGKPYFFHLLYFNEPNSNYYEKIMPKFIEKLKIKKLIRAKLNLYPKTSNIEEHNYHVDFKYPHKTALYYVNTNNGFTIFKNPYKKISSKKNKIILFDELSEHKSTSCTNKDFRITLNINYEF
jgi:hypothetical protein|tara:strand:- start:179 stop:652 length:474 start_codon:yes stop_codon:yes gene_type:complete